MNDEKWEIFLDQAKDNFGDVSVFTEEFFIESNRSQIRCTRDILEFTNSLGRFKIIRENKPKLLDKKMHYSHRQGDSAITEYIFSDTELSHKVTLYKEDQFGEWQELKSDQLDFMLR